ncbi:retrovirus-related pol polyprotein [Moniliophthora roreri]|nr:retrovirus-related pol polyprotein [Moniliophthora roreri]
MHSELLLILEPDNDWVPDTYDKAVIRLNLWEPAMEKKLKKIDNQKAFTPMLRPPNTPTVTMKWHYTLRKDSEGRITERQARLAVRGFTQVKGVHYENTWAIVARDFTAAYLNAKPQGVNYFNLLPEYKN